MAALRVFKLAALGGDPNMAAEGDGRTRQSISPLKSRKLLFNEQEIQMAASLCSCHIREG